MSRHVETFQPEIWGFPEIGLPLVIIHFTGIVHYSPAILGYPHDELDTPHLRKLEFFHREKTGRRCR